MPPATAPLKTKNHPFVFYFPSFLFRRFNELSMKIASVFLFFSSDASGEDSEEKSLMWEKTFFPYCILSELFSLN